MLISDSEAGAMLEEYPETFVLEKIALVEQRIRQAPTPVRLPKAYARKFLEQEWQQRQAGSTQATDQDARAQARRARMEREQADRETAAAEARAKEAAWARYQALDEVGKAAAREAFSRDLGAGEAAGETFVLRQWQASGLDEAGPRLSFASG